MIKARNLCNVFRFIDDLNIINDAGIFEKITEAERMAIILRQLLLDLDIGIKNVKSHIGLFDKRDSFPFNISLKEVIFVNFANFGRFAETNSY